MSERVEYISKNVKPNLEERILPKIELSNCGKVVLKEWKVPMRSLPLWHIYWNMAPGGVLLLPECRIEMSPDKIYLLPSYLMFATTSTGIFEHVHLDFSMQSSLLSRVRKEVIALPVEAFRPLLDRCFQERFSPLISGALIFLVLNEIGEESFAEEGSFPIDPRIQQALNLISSAFRTGQFIGLSNHSISRKIGMSQVNFQHLFKRELKISPHRYILNLRLELAYRLLKESNRSIEDIAEATAFANRYQFTKAFTLLYGLPPGRCRRE